MSHSNPHISQAATEIIALINSRPTSPRQEEIAAILAPHMNAASPKVGVPKRQAEWDRFSAEVRAADAKCRALAAASGGTFTKEVEAAEEELGALEDRLCEVAMTIIAAPVRTLGDLVVRAAIAAHWYGDELNKPRCMEEHALAAVVRGVFDLAGLKFDAEGRLLEEEPAAA